MNLNDQVDSAAHKLKSSARITILYIGIVPSEWPINWCRFGTINKTNLSTYSRGCCGLNERRISNSCANIQITRAIIAPQDHVKSGSNCLGQYFVYLYLRCAFKIQYSESEFGRSARACVIYLLWWACASRKLAKFEKGTSAHELLAVYLVLKRQMLSITKRANFISRPWNWANLAILLAHMDAGSGSRRQLGAQNPT